MDIKLDIDGDIDFTSNDFTLTTTESESLRQRLIIKLSTFQEEWFLDQSVGVPYYQEIFGKGRAKESIDAIFKTKILEEPAVISLVEFVSSLNTGDRSYSLSFKVKSENASEPIPVELTI